MYKLSPSVLSSNFARLGEEIKLIEEGGADLIHLDVMDGQYVPNISFGAPIIKSVRDYTSLPFDVHLMIVEPERYIEDFAKAGADYITIHAESSLHLHRTVQLIKSFGLKAGVSLNPATPLNVLDYILDDLDLVLIMSVNPGFGGQSFIDSSLDKIRSLRTMIDNRDLDCLIEVDGGIKLDNARRVIDAGADIIVVGSDIFKADDIIERTRAFKAL